MTPDFSYAIDPIFTYVIETLDQISHNQGVAAEEVRQRLDNRFREAEAQLGSRKGWELAKYALVAWIDDVMIGAPWGGGEWWENNSMEFSHFNTRDRATEFFKRAEEAGQLSRRDPLEVFYVCVVLGFRGLYGLPEAAFLAEHLGLPPRIDEWAKRTSRSIELAQGRPPIAESPSRMDGAPPLEGKFVLLRWSLGLLALAAITLVAWFLFRPR